MGAALTWFEVDRKGLAEIARRRGIEFVVTEPIQNAWDEDVSRVDISLVAVPNSPTAILEVEDDSPDGFRDLRDAYVLFRESYKIDDPEKRGRFNVGEKLLLSIARSASILTTIGDVRFDEKKGRTFGRNRRESGSKLRAVLRMTREEVSDAVKVIGSLIPPEGIETVFEGGVLTRPPLRAEGEYTLPTEIRGVEGGFRPTRRKARVRIYEPRVGETPSLYEMGIPVDALDVPWHVDVAQKVPLSVDRSSVRSSYRAEVEAVAAELMAARMTDDDASEPWAAAALDRIEDDDAARTILRKRFGKAVVFDPSNPQSNKLALDAGYKVIHGSELSRGAWATVRRVEAFEPAGRVFDTGKVPTSPDGVPPVPFSKWTPAMRRAADYAVRASIYALDGGGLGVEFYDDRSLPFGGVCGGGRVGINLANGYRRVVEDGDQEALDRLLIHEFAHVRGGSDHLAEKFYRECCRIGARLRSFDGRLGR